MKKQSFSWHLVATTALCVAMACTCLTGCGGGGLSDGEVLAKLEGAGLTIEKLPRPVWTRNQRERLEQAPQTVFSLRLSDGAGHTQDVTLLGFDAQWKADAVAPDGVPGFAVGTWFFVGEISQEIRSEIETALL